MPHDRPPWMRRQLKEFAHLANYAKLFKEKVAGFAAAGQPVPILLCEAIRLLPDVRKRIEENDFELPGELWREVENRIVECDWPIEKSKQWKPKGGAPPSGSRRS